MAHIIPVGDAVEVEVKSIQPGLQVETTGLIPGERWQHFAHRIHMAHITSEGGHIIGGVGEFQDSGLDNLGGGFGAEAGGGVAV